jgi:hypothetical protein
MQIPGTIQKTGNSQFKITISCQMSKKIGLANFLSQFGSLKYQEVEDLVDVDMSKVTILQSGLRTSFSFIRLMFPHF